MTSTEEITLSDYEGKKVEIKVADQEEELLGLVVSANDRMIGFRPKGRSNLDLILAHEIEDIRIAPDAEVEMRARRLNLVTIDTVKRHLVDRHGYKLDDINAMSPEASLEFHSALDHSPLSHYHADPPSTTEAAANGD